MSRSRVVFALIILGAFAVVGAGVFLQTIDTLDFGSLSVVEEANDLPEGAIEVVVQSSNTKELWMALMAEQFNAQRIQLDTGETLFVRVEHTGSPLLPELKPAAWSPSNQGWVEEQNTTWRDLHNANLIAETTCPGTINNPIGLAMWRPMAEALGWPNQKITWQQIIDLALHPDGWGSLGHSEWGQFRYGHGHPDFSNSGRLSIVAQIFASKGSVAPLTYEDIWADQTLADVGAVQTAIVHYGERDTFLLDKMVARGPSYLHAVTNYEGNVIRWNLEHAQELRFPLAMVYPVDGTFWEEHPICILENADWLTDKQKQGALIFRDFILHPDQQAQLIATGLRPALEGIALDGEPFTLQNGVISSITPEITGLLPYPSVDLMNNVKAMWHEVKKPSTVVMLIDTSGSMAEGNKMGGAVAGAQRFISQMHPNDDITIVVFSATDNIRVLEPSGRVGEVGEALSQKVGALYADGGTALYQSTTQGLEIIRAQQNANQTEGHSRIYGMVLLSDGADTSSDISEAQMFSLLPSGTESTDIRLYTIAYGDDANQELLQRMANRTNGISFSGGTDKIEEIYFQISSEF